MLIDRPQVVEGSFISNATVATGTADPDNANTGELFFRTDLNVFRVFNNTEWVSFVDGSLFVSHIDDDSRHLTAAQNTFIDDITVTAADVNSITQVKSDLNNLSSTVTDHIADDSRHLTGAQNALLDGLSTGLTATELNYVDGVTSPIQTQINDVKATADGNASALAAHLTDDSRHLTAAQNTLLDGLAQTLTSDELNYVDGVTSPIQTQINNVKSTADTNTTNLATHIADDSRHLTAAQNTLLDGLASTLTATELNYVDGVTSPIQTQLDNLTSVDSTKVAKAGDTMTGTLSINGANNLNVGTTSSSAKVTIVGGTTVTGGESNLNVTSSAPATIPTTISTSSSSATLQIFGGTAAVTGSARGGQIDLVGGGASTAPGTIIFRTGTGTGGTSQPFAGMFDGSGNFILSSSASTSALAKLTVSVPASLHAAFANTGTAAADFGEVRLTGNNTTLKLQSFGSNNTTTGKTSTSWITTGGAQQLVLGVNNSEVLRIGAGTAFLTSAVNRPLSVYSTLVPSDADNSELAAFINSNVATASGSPSSDGRLLSLGGFANGAAFIRNASGGGLRFLIGPLDKFLVDSGSITAYVSTLFLGASTNIPALAVDSSSVTYLRGASTVLQNAAGTASFLTASPAGLIDNLSGNELGWKNLPMSGGWLRGGCFIVSTGQTVTSAMAGAGNVYTIFNNSGSAIAISQGAGVTMRLGGTTAASGTRSLLPYGIATIVFIDNTLAIINGNVT